MKVKILQLNNERKMFWTLIVVIVSCIALYIYFVNQTVFTIVKRQNMEKEISLVNSHIGGLESKYIGTKNAVNLDMAYSLGYKDVSNVAYIPRPTVSTRVTLNSNKI